LIGARPTASSHYRTSSLAMKGLVRGMPKKYSETLRMSLYVERRKPKRLEFYEPTYWTTGDWESDPALLQ